LSLNGHSVLTEVEHGALVTVVQDEAGEVIISAKWETMMIVHVILSR